MNCVFMAMMMNVLAMFRIDLRGDQFGAASTSNVSISCTTAYIIDIGCTKLKASTRKLSIFLAFHTKKK